MSSMQDLPDELLLKILRFMTFQEICKLSRINQRFQRLFNDKSLWQKIRIYCKIVPDWALEKMIESEIKYLNLRHCTIPNGLKPIKNEMKLNYLNISSCNGNDNFLSEMVERSKDLKTLDLSESQINLVSRCISRLPEQSSLAAIDFSMMNNSFLTPNYLSIQVVKLLINNCRHLTGVSFWGTALSDDTIEYICQNLSHKTLRISFCNEDILDEHIAILVKQCNKLEHLDLRETNITFSAVSKIAKSLSKSLISLLLPEKVGLELGLHSVVDQEKLEIFKELQILRYLHIGDWEGSLWFWNENDEYVFNKNIHKEKLSQHFPHLIINQEIWNGVIDDTSPIYKFFQLDGIKRDPWSNFQPDFVH